MATYFYVKFVECERYADDFRAGRLYMNTLEHFVKLEEKLDGRGDRFDALAAWHQPQDISVFEINGHRFNLAEFCGPIKIQEFPAVNILCLYGGSDADFTPMSDDLHSQLEELRTYMQIPRECMRMGPFAVLVHNVTEFNARFDAAVRRERYRSERGPVSYFDPATFSGTFAHPGFCKRDEFSWQREYRCVVEAGLESTGHLVLDVGDLSNVCTILDSESLRDLQVHFKDQPAA